MSTSSRWLSRWHYTRVRPSAEPAPAQFRPGLVRLEDRSTPATITTSGTTATVVLDAADEVVTFSTSTAGEVSLASNKTITRDGSSVSSPQTFTGFTLFEVTDSANNTAVVFADSTTIAYAAAFTVTLDQSPALAAVTFNGTSAFGANDLSVTAGRGIVVSSAAAVTANKVTLDGNYTANSGTGTFVGVEVVGSVTATGTDGVTVHGRGGTAGGKGVRVMGVVASTGTGPLEIRGVGGSGGSSDTTGVEITGTTADVTTVSSKLGVYGTGGGGSKSSSGVVISAGGLVSATLSGNVTVDGTAGTSSTQDDNHGVRITGTGSLVNATDGNIDITGVGGGSGSGTEGNDGVRISAAGAVTATTLGTVTIAGTGGATGSDNSGVRVTGASSQVTTAGGDLTVNGWADGTSTKSDAVLVNDGGRIAAGGEGLLAVTGVGVAGGLGNDGVVVGGANSIISSAGGTATVTGTGGAGGNSNDGVVVQDGGRITAGGTATLDIVGTGGAGGSNNIGFSLTGANSSVDTADGDLTVTATGGGGHAVNIDHTGGMGTAAKLASGGTSDLTINADSFHIEQRALVQAGASGSRTLSFLPRTAGLRISLGGADVLSGVNRTLGLSDLELDRTESATLIIGNASAGPLSVVAAVNLADPTNVQLVSGGDITFTSGGLNANGGNLLLTPGTDAGEGVAPLSSGVEVGTNALSFASGTDLKVAIGGDIADSEYSQFTVLGKVNLFGVDLVLSGSYTPQVGDVFNIISSTQVSGTFNGLPDDTIFTYGTASLRIRYSSTGVSLVVNSLPTGVTTGGPYTVDEGQGLTLTATAADSNSGDTLTYTWDVNGDGTFGDETGGTVTSGGRTLSFTHAQLLALGLGDGPTTVTTLAVRVSDGGTPVTSPASTLTVANVPPTAVVTAGPESVDEGGGPVAYTGAFTDPVADGPYTYAWTATVGGVVVASSSGAVNPDGTVPQFVFTPADSGTYTIALVVTDKDGGASAPATRTLTVNNLAPTITQVFVPPTGVVGTAVVASAAATDPAGAADPLVFTWTVLLNGAVVASGTGATFAFTPTAGGVHTVNLAVTDGDGGTATASRSVAVPVVRVVVPTQPRFSVAVGGAVLVIDPARNTSRVFYPYPGFTGTVSTALADLNNDGQPELVIGAGPGGAPHVKVYDGLTGAEVASFFAFNPGLTGGVFVAAGGGRIAVGAGPGGGPHVKVFDPAGNTLQSFFPYAPGFTGGVRVGLADLDGDGLPEVVTGAGPGGAPHVKVFAGSSLAETASFFAFDPAFSGGVNVAVRGGRIAVGADAGGSPHVKVFDARGGEQASFFAYPPAFTGGVRVAWADLDADGDLDLLTGTGPGGGPHVRGFAPPAYSEVLSFFASDPLDTRGVFVS